MTLCVFDRQFGFILGNAIEWLRERIMQEGKPDPYCVEAPSDPEKYHSTTVVLEQCYEGISKAGRHGDLAMICGTFCPNNRLRFLSPIDPRLLRIWENVLRTFPDADSTGITYQFLLQCDAELSYGLGYAIAWFER